MNEAMRAGQAKLTKLLEADAITAGMYVRVHGDRLVAGRTRPNGAKQKPENDDRVRFTRLGANSFGVRVRRHTGRWEKTPFLGTLEEMVEAVCAFMQHLVVTG